MKNAWKGLIVGALTGMAGGAAMDLASGTQRKAAALLDDAKDKGSAAAKTVTHKAIDLAHQVGQEMETELPGAVRDVSRQMAGSEAAERATDIGHHARAAVRRATGAAAAATRGPKAEAGG